MKLHSKVFLKGKIELLTGLHIGGTGSGIELAQIVTVLKDNLDYPYIPGSSIKGKIRSLLEKFYDNQNKSKLGLHVDGDIAEIFGSASTDEIELKASTRVIIRDSFLIEKENKDEDDILEIKTENTIDRISGIAQHPRPIERVVAGNQFGLNLVFNIYDKEKDYALLNKFMTGLELLEDDYLGGNGSRGYGQVKISFYEIYEKTLVNYENDDTTPTKIISQNQSIKEVKMNLMKEKNENENN